MSTRLSSEVAILSVEYLFLHTWGWETWDGRACWLTEDEIAHGRQYATGEELYDAGISYSLRAVHDGLREALAQGLLVWRENARRNAGQNARQNACQNVRQYALYLQGMVIGDAGEFCGWDTSTPTPDSGTEPLSSPQPDPVALPPQVPVLTQHITALLEALSAAGIALPPVFGAEEGRHKDG